MNELLNILPPELNKTFESLDFEENGDLTVFGINFTSRGTELNFTLKVDFGKGSETQEWKMIVENCVDLKVDFDNIGEYFYFYDEHFLLYEFEDENVELYVKNNAENSEKMLSEIYQLHSVTFDNLFNLEKFINGENLYKVCKANNGLFARGPKKILDFYFNILENNHTNPYFYGSYHPKKWTGNKWEEIQEKYQLAILGKNYFIGTKFEFEKTT